MKQGGRVFWLCDEERSFLHGVMDQAMAKAQKKDISLCVKYAVIGILDDVKVLRRAKVVLRPVVMESIDKRGGAIFRSLFKRHPGFQKLPKPLRGKELHAEAKKLKLVQRSQHVRVGANVIREECEQAPMRIKLHMAEEVGRECKQVSMFKTKRKDCIKQIVQHATVTGVADITQGTLTLK
jgi:hypothetical protein